MKAQGFTPLENASRGPTSIRENADISLPHANKRYSPTGFTLIELLVVIAIIGVLSSVVLASVNSARAKGNYASIMSQMKQLETAAELDYDSRGSYAPDVGPAAMPFGAGIIPTWPTPPCSGWTYDWENWNGGATVRITMRRANVSAVYYYCVYTTGTCDYGNGYPIQDASPKQITCAE